MSSSILQNLRRQLLRGVPTDSTHAKIILSLSDEDLCARDDERHKQQVAREAAKHKESIGNVAVEGFLRGYRRAQR
jgi:hypothetical protein